MISCKLEIQIIVDNLYLINSALLQFTRPRTEADFVPFGDNEKGQSFVEDRSVKLS